MPPIYYLLAAVCTAGRLSFFNNSSNVRPSAGGGEFCAYGGDKVRIIELRPAPPGSGNALARFDVEMPGGIRLFNLKLSDSGNGLRVFAPSALGSATATFDRSLAAEIAATAFMKLGEIAPNENRQSE
jgi:hypothetical protein